MKSSQSVLFIVFHTKRIVAYDGMRVNGNIAFIVFFMFSDCKLLVKSGVVIRPCIWITAYEAWILPTEGMAESEHGKRHLSKSFSTGKRICPRRAANLPALG